MRLAWLSRLVHGALLALALGACNTQAKWTYPLDPSTLYRSQGEPAKLAIAVLPFRESRPPENRSATYLLYLIPAFPFGWATYERPEAARLFNTIDEYELQLDEDLAKAAVRSFEDSRLFDRVYFTFGGETREADLVLRGTALHTTYSGRILSYGLSAAGPALWFLGLPAGTSRNRLDLALELTDREQRAVWTFSFSDARSITQGLYYNWGDDALAFSSLFATAMNGALQDLAARLPEIRRGLVRHGRSPARG
jgi:hypothetical protein